jgi:Leucine-rich repeat (LRR) protein
MPAPRLLCAPRPVGCLCKARPRGFTPSCRLHGAFLRARRDPDATPRVAERGVDRAPPFAHDSVLDLTRTAVKDIEPLRKATRLKTLLLSSRVDDLRALKGLRELRHVDLTGAPVTDLSPLKTLVHLEQLVADNVGLRDLTVVAGLKELHTLSVAHNRELSSIKPLSSLTALTSLTLADTSIKDLTPLAALPAPSSLNIQDTAVVDLGPLARIKTLKKLSVSKSVAQERIDALKKALPELQLNIL